MTTAPPLDLVAAGLAVLRTCAAAVDIAQDSAERVRLVIGLLDPATRPAVAAALRTDEARAILIRLRAIRGLAGPVDGVLAMLTATGGGDDDPSLDELTAPLGVTGLRAPPGFTVGAGGVFADGARIAEAPLVIVAAARDVHTGAARLELAWRHGRRWVREWVDRGEAMDARRVVRLADQGAPANSDNARDVVRYLAAFEAANVAALPATATTCRLGWHGAAFVLPDCTHGGADPITVAASGMETMIEGYRVGGTWEGWKAAIAPALDRPSALLGIIAAAATPLLHILGQPGFVIDWSGETSQGKTTSLLLAASVWGLASDRDGGLVLSWASSSAVGPMAVAALFCHLPVILDDTKRARPEVVGSVLYDIPAGRDRLKGTVTGGLQAIRQWRTILLSSGEAPITSFAPDGAGAHARAIVLRGSPMATREDANAVKANLMVHFGHLGRRLAARLVAADHDALRVRFDALLTARASSAGNTAVQGRMAAYVAILELTLEQLQAVGLPEPECDPIGAAWAAVLDGSREADRAAEALAKLQAWAAANQPRFWGRHEVDARTNVAVVPPGGFVGRWDRPAAGGSLSLVGFNREILERLLLDWRCDVHGVIEAWRQRGWLVGDRKGAEVALTKTTKIDGVSTRVIALKRAIFDVPDAP